MKGGRLIKAQLDSDCNFKSAEIWEYNDHDLLWRRQWLDEDAEIEKTVFANRVVKSLEDIYNHSEYPRPLSELQKVARRVDRVLVTILDVGVDYNHPELAFKIPRPSDENQANEFQLGAIQHEIDRFKRERNELQKKFNNLSGIQKLWKKDEYNSKFKNINDEIAQRAVGWDFKDNDDQPYDYGDGRRNEIHKSFNHGTHVAGITSQGSDDIAILPIRRPDSKTERFYDAVELAYKRGSRIVNISFGSTVKSEVEVLSQAIQDHPDMLFVAAAGNDGKRGEGHLDDFPVYPAAYDYPNLLVVTSVDENNNLSDFSNYSKTKVDVAAPGENIYSLAPENTRREASGTSWATPYVTRIAAKIKFINPALTPEEIISIIRNSVTPIDSLKLKVKYGGVVNEEKAIELAKKTVK